MLRPLPKSDRIYLRKSTTYRDNAYIFFTNIEDDFRLLHMPLEASTTPPNTRLHSNTYSHA